MCTHRWGYMLVLMAYTWVLWARYVSPYMDEPDRWKAVAPFADEASCQRGLQAELADWRKAFAKEKDSLGLVAGRIVMLQEAAKDASGNATKDALGNVVKLPPVMIEHQCWPDTVDPRPR